MKKGFVKNFNIDKAREYLFGRNILGVLTHKTTWNRYCIEEVMKY